MIKNLMHQCKKMLAVDRFSFFLIKLRRMLRGGYQANSSAPLTTQASPKGPNSRQRGYWIRNQRLYSLEHERLSKPNDKSG